MRLIGGHDYYDSALAYGADPSVVFVRHKLHEEKLIPEKKFFIPYENHYRYLHNLGKYQVKLENVTVCVAGITYGGVHVELESSINVKLKHRMIPEITTFWDYDTIIEYFDKFDISFEKIRYTYSRYQKKPETFFFKTDEFRNKLIENRITTATTGIYNLKEDKFWRIDGDDLKNYQFYKVLNPYECFQEISMWVGGVLPKPGNMMVEITDSKIKVEKHGFDKWSFRKMPKKV